MFKYPHLNNEITIKIIDDYKLKINKRANNYRTIIINCEIIMENWKQSGRIVVTLLLLLWLLLRLSNYNLCTSQVCI
jgi:hypothetical protein